MDDEIARRVSKNCLGGRPLPRSLEILWENREAAEDVLDMRLLTKARPAGWDMDEHDVRAHRAMFERIGFFAKDDNGDRFGYWWGADTPEPPVVRLDSDDSYSWAGAHMAEAMLNWFEYGELDEEQLESWNDAKEWLNAHGLPVGELLDGGASTQFLPDLEELYSSLSDQFKGAPWPEVAMSEAPADPADPLSWLLRPGAEVQAAMTAFLGGPVRESRVWTLGNGLVNVIAFDARMPPNPGVLGVAVGATRTDVERVLGAGEERTSETLLYTRDDRDVNIHFNAAQQADNIIMRPRSPE